MFLFFQKSFLSYFLYTASPFYNNAKECRGKDFNMSLNEGDKGDKIGYFSQHNMRELL